MATTTSSPSSTNGTGTTRAEGLAVLRAYVNLTAVHPGPPHVTLDATWRAGRTADLSFRMRRHGRLTRAAVEGFGKFVSLAPTDLADWTLPTLEALGIIEYTTDIDGEIIEVEERVGVAAPVLEQVAAIWEQFGPPPLERCAIASADHAAYTPMTLSDHCAALEHQGFPGELHEDAFAALTAIGLLRREESTALGEEVLWAPYVWGTEAIDIVAFMKKLPVNEREALATLSRKASERPGLPTTQLGADDKLVKAARHAGLLDATPVVAGETERSFAFPPSLEQRVGAGLTDATHERKLFVAHILNGHMYGHPWTGRIDYPVALVNALINKGAVGPTTAARREYGLLEAAGIVRAEETDGGKAMLHLVKEDVAKDSLELLKRALDEDPASHVTSADALWIPGTVTTPERDRNQLAAPQGAQRELIQSTVEELRSEIGRKVRGEELHG
jgi:hypothetical protein